jgi:thiamine pyrophosphate-dependent acetolactate synthase large subunit-like protein
MMKRDEALRVLAGSVPDDIVVATYSSAFDWLRIRPHPLNYVAVGAMGLASSHALGLAIGRPDRRVVVLDGDGSLLMNLPTLVTIREVAPPNLVYFVSVNRTYEANGGHPIPGASFVDFGAIAKGAGWVRAHSYSELPAFREELPSVLKQQGPVFVSLHVEPGHVAPSNYAFIHGAEAREQFRTHLGTVGQPPLSGKTKSL